MIKAVLFDVDGVLFDSFSANTKFFYDLLTFFGHKGPSEEEYVDHMGSHMRDIIKHFSKLEDNDEIEKIWRSGRDRVVPYPHYLLRSPEGVEEVLKSLNQDYTLGVVTSRVADHIFETPELQRNKDVFKVVVSYLDTKKHKPDPEPLFLALEKLNLKTEEAIYVGDTMADVSAANTAGIKVVVYGPKMLKGADFHVDSFHKLSELIKRL